MSFKRGCAVGAGLLAMVVCGLVPPAEAAKKAPSAKTALRTLVRQASHLPRTAASPARRRRLVRTARHAQRVARRHPCVAVADLARFRRTLRGIHVKNDRRHRRARARLAALGPASLTASRRLLASKATKRCGGGVAPTGLDEPRTTVLSSDANGMRLRVRLPDVSFVPRSAGGRSWTQITLPTTDVPTTPGRPGIPFSTETFGVPDGASVGVEAKTVSSYKVDGVDVFPAQPDSLDASPPDFTKPPFATRPFTFDASAYRQAGLQPAAPATGDLAGHVRDLAIGRVLLPAVQYDAARRRLVVPQTVDVNVAFRGGDHTFSGELGSPWEGPQRRLLAGLVNRASILAHINPSIFERCGEEMLVITNPSTVTAANQLSAARNAAGLRTRVVQTGDEPSRAGSTPGAIQAFIRGELTAGGCIHPSYVTIMGDDDLVPTFTTGNPSGIPSDLPYALRDSADELPDVAVGRIIGDDEAALEVAVGKIVGYETTPLSGPILTRALIAAYFQDDDADGREDRTFVQFAETVRRGLVARGVSVDRAYATEASEHPQQFNDGSALPDALKKPAFAWDGDAADISASWNAGDFLVVHRDHGWSQGWGTPAFTSPNVSALTNGAQLPVVLSVNCSSGAYDSDESSFATTALDKADGGAVGVFGDTRDSPSWHNTQLAFGIVDALLPSVLPSEGPATAQRVGDALINGKLRLAGLASPGSDANTRNELYLWHYFGDPSMQLWGGGHAPFFIDPSRFQAIFLATSPDPGPYAVRFGGPAELAGQTVSLLRGGLVIGKALIGGDGTATIPAAFGDGSVRPGELRVAVEPDGGPPVSAGVDGVPAPPPGQTGAIPPSTVTQACPQGGRIGAPLTVTGTLAPARPNATVSVTFTPPGGGAAHVVSATTVSDGSWSASVTPGAGEAGTWSIQASFAGDATSGPASAQACSTTVARAATQLSQQCPKSGEVGQPLTVQGSLTGVPAGTTVDVTFQAPSIRNVPGRQVVQHVQTDVDGGWSASVTPQQGEAGDWTVSSAYAGDGDRVPASAGPCTVPVANPISP